MINHLANTDYKIPHFITDQRGKYKARKPLTEEQIIKAATAILKSRVAKKGHLISCPEDTKRLLTTHMANYDNEVFICLFLDNKHQVISMEEMFYGTIDGATVHPRVVVKRALELNAAAVIVAHNHPSGLPQPSRNDMLITNRLKESLQLVEIRLLDHVIVGGHQCASLAERGLI